MTKIIILGDSWGEPNWRLARQGFTAQGHSEYRLRDLGCTVTNYSSSGGSNLTTWLAWAQDLTAADWLIWFHTDIGRDWPWQELSRGWHYQELMDQTADQVYSRAQAIYARSNRPKIILVEGQSRRHRPQFDQYFSPHTVITDWRSQLLGRELPYSQLIGPLSSADKNFFRSCRDSLELAHSLITDVETIMEAMKHSELFPDNCHPGDQAHAQLTQQLWEIVCPSAKRQRSDFFT